MRNANTRWITVVLLVVGSVMVHGAESAVTEYIGDLSSDSAPVRCNAAEALGRIGDKKAVPALIKVLDDESQMVRCRAAEALGKIKDRRGVEPLIGVLSDDSANVRWYAAYALGEIRDSRAVDALLKAVTDANWLVRKHAAWALRQIGDEGAVRPLVQALNSGEIDMERAVWVLKKIKPEAAAEPLIEALKNADESGRESAAYALGQLGIAEAVGPLADALNDDSADVRMAVAKALVKIGDPRMLDLLKRAAVDEQVPEVKSILQEAVYGLLRARGLVAYWSFDDSDGETVADFTGGESKGQIEGATVVDGKSGKALKFDGEDDCVEFGKPGNIPVGNAKMTFLAWVKPEKKTGVVLVRGGAWCGYSFIVQDGVAAFGIHREKEGPTFLAKGKTKIVGDWAHIAGVIDKKSVKIFVNGELEGKKEIPDLIKAGAGQGLQIGFDKGNSPVGVTDHFGGIIDEVKIMKKALSAEEIAEKYEADT